jgi:hypothetical protein
MSSETFNSLSGFSVIVKIQGQAAPQVEQKIEKTE